MSLPKSLSVRLLLLFVAAAITSVFILGFLFSSGLSSQWRNSIRPHLAQYVEYVRDDIGDPPSFEQADAMAESMQVVIHIYRDGVPQHSTTDTNFDPNDYRFKPVKPRHLPGPRRNQSKQPPLPKLEFSNRQDRPIVKIPMKQHNVYIELDSFRGDNRFRRIHLWLLPLALIALLTALYALLRNRWQSVSPNTC